VLYTKAQILEIKSYVNAIALLYIEMNNVKVILADMDEDLFMREHLIESKEFDDLIDLCEVPYKMIENWNRVVFSD